MIWAIIPGWLKRALAWLVAGLGIIWAAWLAGKREARRETALEAAERIAKAEIKRGRIDDGIDQDTDLVRRARASGVVRHTEH